MKEELTFKYFNFSVFLHFIGRLLYRTFVPIILLNNGFSMNEVLIYTIGFSIITILISIISYHIMKKRNIILINILAIISEIFLLILLFPNEITYLFFILIILFEGFYYGFYYMSHFSIITHYTTIKRLGNNLGNITIFNNIASIITPILGGFILIFSKFYLILTSLIFLILSIIPLSKIANKNLSHKNVNKIKISNIKIESLNLVFGSSFEIIIFFMWALFIYVKGASILDISFIPATVALSNCFVIYFMKSKLNNHKFRNILKVVSILGIMIISLQRYFYFNYILIGNIFMGLFLMIYTISINHEIIAKFKGYSVSHTSLIFQLLSFIPWVLIVSFVFIVGLNHIIIIPFFIGILYFIVNFKSIKKLFV